MKQKKLSNFKRIIIMIMGIIIGIVVIIMGLNISSNTIDLTVAGISTGIYGYALMIVLLTTISGALIKSAVYGKYNL